MLSVIAQEMPCFAGLASLISSHRHHKHHPRSSRFTVFIFKVNDLYKNIQKVTQFEKFGIGSSNKNDLPCSSHETSLGQIPRPISFRNSSIIFIFKHQCPAFLNIGCIKTTKSKVKYQNAGWVCNFIPPPKAYRNKLPALVSEVSRLLILQYAVQWLL